MSEESDIYSKACSAITFDARQPIRVDRDTTVLFNNIEIWTVIFKLLKIALPHHDVTMSIDGRVNITRFAMDKRISFDLSGGDVSLYTPHAEFDGRRTVGVIMPGSTPKQMSLEAFRLANMHL